MIRAMRPQLPLLAVALVLTACASSSQDKVTTAATTPLSDLNVVRADIPEVLKAAAAAPYAMPADASCGGLAAGIRALDEALGPDLDVPHTSGNTGLLDRGEDAATGALQRTAERYTKQVSAAITAGGVRRGYLRGLSTAKACTAAPAKAASAV
jgi:hypothetical protein